MVEVALMGRSANVFRYMDVAQGMLRGHGPPTLSQMGAQCVTRLENYPCHQAPVERNEKNDASYFRKVPTLFRSAGNYVIGEYSTL